jgi:hypothetical protein
MENTERPFDFATEYNDLLDSIIRIERNANLAQRTDLRVMLKLAGTIGIAESLKHPEVPAPFRKR